MTTLYPVPFPGRGVFAESYAIYGATMHCMHDLVLSVGQWIPYTDPSTLEDAMCPATEGNACAAEHQDDSWSRGLTAPMHAARGESLGSRD